MNFQRENWIDRIFKDKLANYELGRPDHLWPQIELEMRKEGKLRWLYGHYLSKWILIASLLTTTAAGLYFVYMNNKKDRLIEDKRVLYSSGPGNLHTPDLNATKSTDYENCNPRSFHSDSEDLNRENSRNFKESSAMRRKAIELGYKKWKNPTTNITYRTGRTTAHGTTNTQQHSERVTQNTENFADEGQVSKIEHIREVEILKSVPTFEGVSYNKPFALGHSNVPKLWKDSRKKEAEDACSLKKQGRTRYFIDLYYQPEVMSNNIKALSSDFEQYADARKNAESFVYSNSFGVRLSAVFRNGLVTRTGLNISHTKGRFDYVKERQEIVIIIKNSNNVPIDTIKEFKILMNKTYNRYRLVDLPLMVGYEYNLDKFSLTIQGGSAINLAFSQSGYIYSPDLTKTFPLNGVQTPEGSQYVFKPRAGISLIGSLGLNYEITPSWSVNFEPNIRYYLNSLSHPSYPLSQNFVSCGLMAGVRYRVR